MKKSTFLTFIFSFIPGCGLMYLGYMKKGLQTMILFVFTMFLSIVFSSNYLRSTELIFVLSLPVIWLYQMFYSMHTVSRMKSLSFETPIDDNFFIPHKLYEHSFLKKLTSNRIIAIALIIIGCFWLFTLMLDTLYYYSYLFIDAFRLALDVIRRYLMSAVISVGLITAGFKLLKGSGKNIKHDNGENSNNGEEK